MFADKVYSAEVYGNQLKTEIADITDNLLFNLYGDFGSSGDIKLVLCDTKSHIKHSDITKQFLFHFHLKKVLDLGDIHKIKVTYTHPKKKLTEGQKTKCIWFLKQIQINYDRKKFKFEHNKSLTTDNSRANRKIELKLLEQVSFLQY